MDHIADENDLGLLNEMGDEIRADAPVLRAVAALAGGGLLMGVLVFRALGPLSLRISRRTGIPHSRVRRTLALVAPLVLGLAGLRAGRRSRPRGYPGRHAK
ncbi:hypothetical protein ABGB12_20350 [Actinocorallia sp. B10E7]|uniref:hypothetical protein n=1 Tax=Actinocorallia sp. B10E7 TaxID=3153558 RepID=UPI00325C3670